jgi:two-component system, NtrC family, nitrogen regulation sensor histidine kinase NtrY
LELRDRLFTIKSKNMVSEKLLHHRTRNILLVLNVISFIGAGILIAWKNYTASSLLFIAGMIFIYLLIRIYEATNEIITFFFDSLRNDDTTLHFPVKIKNKTLTRLYESMNLLNKYFQEIKIRNEYNESYYKTLIQHASTGLLVLDSNNKVELINKAACIYAGVSPESTNKNILKIKHPAFYEAVCNLKPGENVTYRNLISNNLQMLFFRATLIRRKETELKLVSIQDIRHELEFKELESYRKLISVLTHEIMNMLSPLTSVSSELYSMFRYNDLPRDLTQIDETTIRTAVNGLQLINEQSNSLLNFVNNYRKISRIPQPDFITFKVDEWAEQMKIAFSGKMQENKIDFQITVEKSLLEIIADKKLLNQVMINLINNSIDAVMENERGRQILIYIMKNLQNNIIIRVINNGPLIPPELLEKIFVPFFTTKKNGSGIGLSISQEIMKLHNGSVIAVSSKESQTCFIVEF